MVRREALDRLLDPSAYDPRAKPGMEENPAQRSALREWHDENVLSHRRALTPAQLRAATGLSDRYISLIHRSVIAPVLQKYFRMLQVAFPKRQRIYLLN